jgi:hypothetical protein
LPLQVDVLLNSVFVTHHTSGLCVPFVVVVNISIAHSFLVLARCISLVVSPFWFRSVDVSDSIDRWPALVFQTC